MKLKAYLKARGLWMKAFAERIGYSVQHVSETCSGRRKAGKKYIKIVEKETEGVVSQADWTVDKKDPNQLEFNFPQMEEKICL